MLQENRGAIHDFSQRGLGEAEKLIVDSRSLVAELNRIADQLDRDPARFLFGNRREGISRDDCNNPSVRKRCGRWCPGERSAGWSLWRH